MTFQGSQNARSSSHANRTNRQPLRQACIEALEQRQLLSAPVIQGIGSTDGVFSAQVVPAKKGLVLPIRGYDADGDPISYKVTSSNKAFKVQLFKNNPTWKLSVYTTTRSGSNYPVEEQTPAGQSTVTGDMTFQLFKNLTPKTVSYITGLTNAGFYNNLTFHRLADLSGAQGSQPEWILQGGDPQGNGQGGPGFQFEDEFVKNLIFSGQDQLAMANSGPDTNGSQFFITSNPTRHLDYVHTIFGQMLRGQDTLQQLINIGAITSSDPTKNGMPNQDIHISSAQIIQDTQDAVMMITAPASGQTTLTITASDGKGGVKTQKLLVVAKKDKTNEPNFFYPIPNDGVTPVGTPYSIKLNAFDSEGDAPVWNGQFLNGTNANAVLEGNMLTIVPYPNYKGPIVMRLTASTSNNSTRQDAETITIGVGTNPLKGSHGVNVKAVSGTSGTFEVATFRSNNAQFTAKDYNAQINWGDGHVTSGTIKKTSKTTYSVSGTNSYANEGKFPINVLISDKYGAITKTLSYGLVADAPLKPATATGNTLYGTEDVNLTDPSSGSTAVTVGSFIDGDKNGKTTDYTGTIDWGDGTRSEATFASSSTSSTTGAMFDVRSKDAHKYADPGTYTVKVAVKDKGGSTTDIISTAVIGRSNLIVSLGSSTYLNEGSDLVSEASFTDNGNGSGWTVTVDYGDGTPTEQLPLTPSDSNSRVMNFTLNHKYADSSPSGKPYIVRAVVTDQTGATANSTMSVTVNNLAPTMTSLTGSTTAVVGQPAWLFMSADDISPADVTAGFSYQIAWDSVANPSTTTSTSAKATSASHAYTAPGTYVASVTALDKDTSPASAAMTWSINVKFAALMPDLLDPTKQTLVVGGTTGADTISIVPDAAGGVDAIINTVTYGPFNPTARIKVYGYGGDDAIAVNPAITMPVELYGGDGNDTLVGGGGNDILVGGNGDDVLRGAGGRNVLIGDGGKDSLTAGSGGDILVSGSTSYDGDSAALGQISNEWSRNASYSDRVAHLTGAKNGLNGNAFLVTKRLTSDSDEDVLRGGSGADLFYAQTKTATKDILSGKTADETLFELPAPPSYTFG